MKISEKGETRAEETVFGGLRFLDLHDQIGFRPDVGCGGNDGGAGVRVLVVGKRTAFARMGFDKHLVTRFTESRGTARNQTDASLVVFDFFGDADDHGSVFGTVCRRRSD